MTQNDVCGTNFVVGLGAHEQSNTIYQTLVAKVRSGSQYRAWVCMRKPFLLPIGLPGHSCSDHWEKFDVDKAACKVCSDIHVCSARTCPSAIESDGVICTVTGLFLSQRLVDQHDFPMNTENAFCTVARNPVVVFAQETPVDQSELDNITRILAGILTSNKTQLSITSETDKLMNKMRSVCLRQMRKCRLMKRIPNLCELESYLCGHLNGHRIPPQSVMASMDERMECIRFSATAICRLIHFMRTHCRNIPSCMKQGGIVVGMLYMMRSGVTIDNITVLPRIARLKHILPLEQHLPTFFKVRAKVVTEAENVIKYNMRGVNPRSLALLAQTQCITRTR
jgi:hypothetical protein